MKSRIKTILSILCICCLLFTFTSCGSGSDITLEELGEIVSLHTEIQNTFLRSANYADFNSWTAEDGSEEASLPAPVHFAWQVSTGLQKRVEKFVLEISEWHNFYESVQYETTGNHLDVYNLKSGTFYFWRVTAVTSNGKRVVSNASSFETEDLAPRCIYVDGVTNVRDLGGWQTEAGYYVKQGMIFRSGRFNESQIDTLVVEITDKGIHTLLDELGIRTEIDLRMDEDHPNCVHGLETSGITSSVLGEDVNYYNVPMEYIMGDNFNYLSDARFYNSIKKFFSYLADESNYPIIYHCNIGTDRTGLFAFLVNGLLGVSEENLYRDYLFSNFGDIGTARTLNNIKSYHQKINTYKGSTFAEKIENCLLDIGVRQEEIDAIRNLMLE